MGIDVFKISLSTPPDHAYRPGDVVKGTVQLNVSPDTDLSEGMTITIYGQAHVEWKEHNGNNTIYYEGDDELFEDSLIHTVSMDQTSYPFSMAIPTNSFLPWTMVTPHGRVEYGVKAVIKRPWFKMGNKTANVIFILNSHVSSRLSSAEMSAYISSITTSNSDESKAGCCCFPFCCWYLFSSEAIKMNLDVASAWAYPGEEVNFTLEVDNTGTKRELGSAKVQLIGIWTHYAQAKLIFASGPVKEKESEFVLLEELIPMKIVPGETQTQKGKLKVPMDVLPTHVDSKVLKLKYKLRGIMDEISGTRCLKIPATVEVDILIGTLGANETTVLNEIVY